MQHVTTANKQSQRLLCVLLAGCSALRPLPEPAKAHRQLQGVDNIESVNWGNFECSGMDDIGFSTNYKALDVPEHGVIMGQVKIHNRGVQPFEFRTPGFRLTGAAGFMDSAMKCPDNQVPAGGVMQVNGHLTQLSCHSLYSILGGPSFVLSSSGCHLPAWHHCCSQAVCPVSVPNPTLPVTVLSALQCGFAAPAMDSLQFDSFQPFFVPKRSVFPCFCQQPFGIEPFVTFDESPIKSFADAAAKAFGGETASLEAGAVLVACACGCTAHAVCSILAAACTRVHQGVSGAVSPGSPAEARQGTHATTLRLRTAYSADAQLQAAVTPAQPGVLTTTCSHATTFGAQPRHPN